MAEDPYKGDDLERSEEPTPKRREEAREKGQVAKSRLLIPAATLLAIVLALRFGGGELIIRIQRLFVGFFSLAGGTGQLDREVLFDLSMEAGLLFAPILLPFFGGIVCAGIGSGLLQTGFVLTAEPLRFDPSRLNPFAGLRRLFSLDAVAEMIKAVLLVAGLAALGFFCLYSGMAELATLNSLSVEDVTTYVGREAILVIGFAVAVVSAFAALDYLYQRWRIEKQLRMSRHDIKEEIREQEGDPQLKGHLRGLRQKLSRRRMMAAIPKADVIITNPTELAIAVRYRAAEMAAPKVLGKGAGYVAQRIREIARENGIAIVENKTLARLLFRQVEVGQEIPEALYRAVAGVLAYVYRLRRGPARTRLQGETTQA
jgi:flagellar biosynthetic protein FlhB